MMLRVNSFLGCISLPAGSHFIGIITALGAILRVIGYSAIAAEINRITPDIMENKDYLYTVQGLLIAIILVDATVFFFGACLAYGATKYRSGCVKAWTRSHQLVIPVSFACYMGLALVYFIAGVPGIGFIILVFGWARAAVSSYFYVVVRSFQRDLGFAVMP